MLSSFKMIVLKDKLYFKILSQLLKIGKLGMGLSAWLIRTPYTAIFVASFFRRLSAETSDHFVVFDTIRSSICFKKPVADGWIKVSVVFEREREIERLLPSCRPLKLCQNQKTTTR